MKILVLGDIMVDRYTYVKTTRRAAEADMPVWDEVKSEFRPGGAANLARNLKVIGGSDVEVFLCGILKPGEAHSMVKSYGINMDLVVSGDAMVKHRFVGPDDSYLFRHDNFRKFDPDDVQWLETMFCNSITRWDFDAAVISDYDKGTVTPEIAALAVKLPLCVVDSKRADIRLFEGANVLKVNEHEYSTQVSSRNYSNFTYFFECCVVTLGSRGAELQQCEKVKSNERRYMIHKEFFGTPSLEAKDVTGCGDTFTAAMTYSLLKTKDIRTAIKFANMCAGQVVTKFGTETV